MSAIASKVATKLLKDRAEQYQPTDPHYEYYEENGKKKKKKRGIPAGLSKRDAKILKKIRKRAHYLDKGMNLCGFRVGWTFFIGIIPGAGDVANALLNYSLVYKPSKKLELPEDLLHRMLFNNAVSAGVGFVPLAGDIFLAAWKANSRNAHLVEAYLTIRGQEYLASLGHGATTIPEAGVSGANAGALRRFFMGEPSNYGSMEHVGIAGNGARPGQAGAGTGGTAGTATTGEAPRLPERVGGVRV